MKQEQRPKVPEHDPMDKDVNTRSIVRLGAALAAVVVLVLVALGPFTRWMTAPEPGDKAPAPLATELSRVPPEPRLQPVPTAQLQDLRAYEKQRLSSYGWVDKNKGLAHIPIDRAIALMAERGLPVRPEGQKPADHGLTVPTDSSLGKPKKEEEMP